MDIREERERLESLEQEEDDRQWELLKTSNGLKEYIFMTAELQRHFFVLGKDLKDAEQYWMRIDGMKRKWFDLEHLPVRLEYDKERCKDWKCEDFWANNENPDKKTYINLTSKGNSLTLWLNCDNHYK